MKKFREFLMEKSSPEAEKITLQRCKDHIRRVKYFYNKLIEANMIPDDCLNSAEVNRHDADKLEPDNVRRQSLRMTPNGKPDPEDADDIYNVVRDHVKSNPHHCEYWGNSDQDHMSKNINCTKMPDKYIYEMMADWASTAEERGNAIIDWYNMCVIKGEGDNGSEPHGDRWIFSRHQKDIMLKCMEYLQGEIDPSMKRNYGFKYIDPALVKK